MPKPKPNDEKPHAIKIWLKGKGRIAEIEISIVNTIKIFQNNDIILF
jgi:hypothetical protein